MSVKVMAQVWELDLPQNLKLLALALADWADDEGANIYPSINRIAWKIGVHRATVKRQLRQLEDEGILETVVPGGGRAKTTRYALHPGKGRKLHPFISEAEKGASENGKGRISDQNGRTAMRPEPPIEPSKEPIASQASNRPRNQIWDELDRLFGKVTNDGSRGRRAKALKLLGQSEATPYEMGKRASRWKEKFPGAVLTDIALAVNWDRLGNHQVEIKVCDNCNNEVLAYDDSGERVPFISPEAVSFEQCPVCQ